MAERRYNSFTEFWPHYVTEHSKPSTRLLHLLGTSIALC
ncbi:MAG: Mpo1-like protein, partial [Pyrinomonadaceae bacterium]